MESEEGKLWNGMAKEREEGRYNGEERTTAPHREKYQFQIDRLAPRPTIDFYGINPTHFPLGLDERILAPDCACSPIEAG